MEILIIGSAVVALMIYVSTKIKRNAASAFEEEAVEIDDFSLVKPEGFLSPIKENSEFAFEAFSKDFGHEEAEIFRQSSLNVRVFEEQDFAEVCAQAKQSVDKILAEEINDEPDGMKTFWMRGEKEENSVEMEIYRKIIGKNRKVFDLQISVLREHLEIYAGRIRKLLESFRVK